MRMISLWTLVLISVLMPRHVLAADAPAIHVQAHRGGLLEAPENTLAAFYYAWRLGGIPEIDIRTTGDGTIICLHDSTLKRTSNATEQADIPVSDLALSDIQNYDVGASFDERFRGERIPTLEQVFDVLKRHPDYEVYLDLKSVDLKHLAALIDSYGIARQLIFCHNDIRSCQQLKSAIPALRTMLWIGGTPEVLWSKYQAVAGEGFTDLDQVQLHLASVEQADWPFALSREQLETALHQTAAAGIDLELLPFSFTCESLRSLTELGIHWYATDAPQRFHDCLGKTTQTTFLKNGVTAHRGDSGNYPENTMVAIDSAIALGADWVEIDIFMTADGEIVVSHDTTTERFADQNLVVAESTLATLQTLDVATGFRVEKGLTKAHCPPASMPTLRQVIMRMQLQRRTRLSIQPKAPIVDETIALIQELDAAPWVGFNDGDLAKMRRVKELAPSIPVFWDRFKESPLKDDLVTAKGLGFESIVPHVGALTPAVVEMIKDAGFEVGAWTINDEKTMQHMLNLGVDRIYTDYPERLLALHAGHPSGK